MQVSEDIITEKVTVTHCNHYIGHTLDICHFKISSETMMRIAAKLQMGISIDRILDDVHDEVTGLIKKEYLISRQDVHNIKSQLDLHSIEKHQNDLFSVSAWVAEMREMPYNPVIVFKNQGVNQDNECNSLGDEDFLLAIQTEFQRDRMHKYGDKVICMDDTHSTNVSDFSLITVLEMTMVREYRWPVLLLIGLMQPY